MILLAIPAYLLLGVCVVLITMHRQSGITLLGVLGVAAFWAILPVLCLLSIALAGIGTLPAYVARKAFEK